jgi:pristinamycin I synthase-3/4
VWQRERLQGSALERLLDYWQKRLGGGLTPLPLPTDRAPAKEPSYYGRSESLILPRPLVAAIRATARRVECTFFMFMLTAFKILLQRYTEQSDITVGVPVAGRTHPATEALIGFFVNTVVMRTDLSGNPTFQEASARVRTTAIEAYANQEVPLDLLVQKLHPERDGVGRQPLFRVMYSHHNYARERYRLDNLLMERVEVAAEDAKFDLVLLTDESSTEELHVELNYSIDLFDDATIKIMLQRLVTLLKNIVATPQARLSALGMLSSDEEADLEGRKSTEAAELQNRLRRLRRSAVKLQ